MENDTVTSDTAEAFDSLRDYIQAVDERGDLQEIRGADWDLEIGAITEAVAHSEAPRALLFDDVEGYPEGYRVATNLYITEDLQALGLGLDPSLSGVDLVKQWRKRTNDLELHEPVAVDDGPVRENVMEGDDVDITKIPVPFWHEHDGGRFFGTGDTVTTRGVDGEWKNTAVYRSQIHDEKTLGILVVQTHHGWGQMAEHWERGEDAPILITGGQSPYLYAAACLPLPRGKTEMEYAGGLKGEPLEVIEDEDTGLPVPAHAEIAVLGHVPPPEEELRLEGPFGECGGYYAGGTQERPVIHIDKIWHRDNPILQGNPPMAGSASEHALGAEISTSARIWDSIDDDIPNVRGVYSVYQECQAGCDFTAVSIKQDYAGHAKQAAAAAMGAYANVTMNNAVIVVDEDIDPANTDEVLFALTSRCDPAQDIDIVRGVPSMELDARISPERKEAGDLTTSSMLIDACKPYHWREEYPLTNRLEEDHRAEVVEKWNLDDWE
ncbi:MAG: UbiD family decarboxylase [Salinigranum sp.]